jgi:hypothetical protein
MSRASRRLDGEIAPTRSGFDTHDRAKATPARPRRYLCGNCSGSMLDMKAFAIAHLERTIAASLLTRYKAGDSFCSVTVPKIEVQRRDKGGL